MKSKLVLAPLNHDCHAMIGKHCTKPRGICLASQWSATTKDIKEYTWPTNWWRILWTFWNIDIDWKCSFQLSCQFNAKSGAIDQLSFGDRPVDRDRLVGNPWCRLTCLQEFIDTTMRWVYEWSRLVTGYKEAEAAEVKPSQNLPWNRKTALNPYKFRQQLAKSTSNNDKK